MSTPRLAAIVSQFNPEVTQGLLAGARKACAERLVPLPERDIYKAPGAFEIPLIAQTLAHTGRYDAIICLGCVIKGDTAHFEYISQAASQGLMQASLSTQVPMAFGILTTYTDEQAELRSGDNSENKGREAAFAALDAVAVKRAIMTRED